MSVVIPIQPKGPNPNKVEFKSQAWFSRRVVLALVVFITIISALIPLLVFAEGNSCWDKDSITGVADSAVLELSVESVYKGTNSKNRPRNYAVGLEFMAWFVSANGAVGIIPMDNLNLGEEEAGAFVPQGELGGRTYFYNQKKPLQIPMKLINQRVAKSVGYDWSVKLTLTVKDYSGLENMLGFPSRVQGRSIFIANMRNLVAAHPISPTSLLAVPVDEDTVYVRFRWKCQ